MKKIPSLFKRDYNTHLCYNEVTPECEWVLNGEGYPTIKIDGTCCMIKEGRLYKRYDRKLKKGIAKAFKKEKFPLELHHFKEAPEGFIPCEPEPDKNTGHWPGWLECDANKPEDKYHFEGYFNSNGECLDDGTYELIGPKIQNNPYDMETYELYKHGYIKYNIDEINFLSLRNLLKNFKIEGFVFYHKDGRRAKVKRTDFGFEWPIKG